VSIRQGFVDELVEYVPFFFFPPSTLAALALRVVVFSFGIVLVRC
jgi:hypothetical protein